MTDLLSCYTRRIPFAFVDPSSLSQPLNDAQLKIWKLCIKESGELALAIRDEVWVEVEHLCRKSKQICTDLLISKLEVEAAAALSARVSAVNLGDIDSCSYGVGPYGAGPSVTSAIGVVDIYAAENLVSSQIKSRFLWRSISNLVDWGSDYEREVNKTLKALLKVQQEGGLNDHSETKITFAVHIQCILCQLLRYLDSLYRYVESIPGVKLYNLGDRSVDRCIGVEVSTERSSCDDNKRV